LKDENQYYTSYKLFYRPGLGMANCFWCFAYHAAYWCTFAKTQLVYFYFTRRLARPI